MLLAMLSLLSTSILTGTSMEIGLGSQNAYNRYSQQVFAEANIPQSEMNALYDFYVSTNGQNWKWDQSNGIPWNFTSTANPCEEHWQGLVCTATAPNHIYIVDLISVNLQGSIPPSISNLTELTTFTVLYNGLTGSLPDTMRDLHKLTTIDVNFNMLSGPLPPWLTDLPQLIQILADFNAFTGTIPATYCDLSLLIVLAVGGNQLTGPIPSCLADLTQMTTMDLFFNALTGTLPVGLPAGLWFLALEYNQLTGSLPDSWSSLTQLQEFALFNNSISGAIPASYGALTELNNVRAYNNQLSGSLPSTICAWTLLLWIDLHSNHLTGSIPTCICDMTSATVFALSGNRLTGSLPPGIASLHFLQELLLGRNHLSGNLNAIFNATAQTSLTTIQLNNNQFTGVLPAEAFRLPSLLTFAAVSNCFRGQLPDNLCGAQTLRSLILDGFGTASTCRNEFLPGVSSSYTLRHTLGQPLPACLLQMPNITALHLSGTGLTGSLPADVTLSPTLFSLSLSHNALTGAIPAQFQSKQWYSLDLSYNRITGTLDADWVANTTFAADKVTSKFYSAITYFRVALLRSYNITLASFNISVPTLYVSIYLDNNRLSGRIPIALQGMHDVAILGSNVFDCNSAQSNLPHRDNGAKHYQCASDTFNAAYYAWLGIAAIVSGALALAWFARTALSKFVDIPYAAQLLQDWYGAVARLHRESPLPHLVGTQQAVRFLVTLALQCAAFILLALLPVYLAFSHYSGTLTHQYAWVASGAYLSGIGASVVIFILLLCLITWVVYSFHRSAYGKIARSPPNGNHHSLLRGLGVQLAFLTVNLVVVVGVNVTYVYVAIYHSNDLLVLAQIALSVFKLVWNNMCSPLLLRMCLRFLSAEGDENAENSDTLGRVGSGFTTLQTAVALLNNIVIPCLVVAVVSPNCFYNVFVAAPEVTSSYSYDTCAVSSRGNGVCAVPLPVVSDTSYHPPFTYNYQCSSSMITYYAPAFVTLCIISGVVTPILQVVGLSCYQRATFGTLWFRFLDKALTRILKPVTSEASHLRSKEQGGTYDRTRPVYNAKRVLIALIMFTGLLLTFGAMFPPLGVAITVTLATLAVLSRLQLGRFLAAAVDARMPEILQLVERECVDLDASAVISRSKWMLVTVSCWFYTLFLFDTLGDAAGFDGAYWVLIAMPLAPLVLYAAVRVQSQYELASCGTETATLQDTKNVLSSGNGTESIVSRGDSDVERLSFPMELQKKEDRL